ASWMLLRPPFFFSSRRRHTSSKRDWSSDVCSSDLVRGRIGPITADEQIAPQRRLEDVRLLRAPRDASGDVLRRESRRVAPVDDEIGRASCRESVSMSGREGAANSTTETSEGE